MKGVRWTRGVKDRVEYVNKGVSWNKGVKACGGVRRVSWTKAMTDCVGVRDEGSELE
jgi:hypothetical protein